MGLRVSSSRHQPTAVSLPETLSFEFQFNQLLQDFNQLPLAQNPFVGAITEESNIGWLPSRTGNNGAKMPYQQYLLKKIAANIQAKRNLANVVYELANRGLSSKNLASYPNYFRTLFQFVYQRYPEATADLVAPAIVILLGKALGYLNEPLRKELLR